MLNRVTHRLVRSCLIEERHTRPWITLPRRAFTGGQDRWDYSFRLYTLLDDVLIQDKAGNENAYFVLVHLPYSNHCQKWSISASASCQSCSWNPPANPRFSARK